MSKLATICYIDNGEALLLLHRNKKPNDVHAGKWIGVGGKIERGETPEECARREVFEETGLTVQRLEIQGIITFPEFTPAQDWYTYVFRIIEYSGTIRDICTEGTLEWVPYDQVLSKPTWKGDKIFLEWILNDQPFFSAKFTYQEERLVEHDVIFYPTVVA